MPPKRVRKPTEKAAKPPPATTRSAPAKKRVNKRKTPLPPSPRPSSPLSALGASSPPPSTQLTAQIPPPVVYFVEYSIFFEHIELRKNTEMGGFSGRFSPRLYPCFCLELAQETARQRGLATYLYQNEVFIKPLGGKGDPWPIDWMPATSLHWAMHIQPIINQIASHAKKGQDPTINLKIKSVFSRYEGRLPEAADTASSAQFTATVSQQTIQGSLNLSTQPSKTPAKRGRSTTENMLAESRDRDRLSNDHPSIMPLMKRWKCTLIFCYNNKVSGECWVGRDTLHYQISRHILGVWAKYIREGQADAEHIPPDLL